MLGMTQAWHCRFPVLVAAKSNGFMIPGILKEKTFAATANALTPLTHSLTHSLTQATRFQEPPSLTRSPIHSRAHGRFTCSFIYLKDSHSPSPCLDFHSTSLVKLLLLQQRAKSLTQLKPLISKHSGILLQKKSRKCTKCRIASHNRAGSPRKRTQRNTASSSLSSARTRKTEQLKKVETSWKKLKQVEKRLGWLGGFFGHRIPVIPFNILEPFSFWLAVLFSRSCKQPFSVCGKNRIRIL